MLVELRIKNFAIIDELHCSFGPGLNVISGETGAGKSILIGAVGLLLGERASPDIIRTSEETAVVEALFQPDETDRLEETLADMGLEGEDGLLLRRVVTRSGKNRVYVNGSPATLGMMARLSEALINICGQHEHQLLLQAENHLDILDDFGGLGPSRSAYERLFGEYGELKARVRELSERKREGHEREDLLRYQLQEIEAAATAVGEDERLLAEKKVLANVQKLRESAQRAYDTLYGREGSVLAELRQVLTDVREIAQLDAGFALSEKDVEAIYYQAEDWALTLREYSRRLSFEPERAAAVDERLEVLARLKRKYGGSLNAVLDRAEAMRTELAVRAHIDEDLEAAEADLKAVRTRLIGEAESLSGQRKAAAAVLERAVETELRTLRMPDVLFSVAFHGGGDGAEGPALNARGMDEAEFFLSTNVGEELKPLHRIASGGELSRIILALKKVLARTGSVATIVFDEVDSGIGGATAEVVGERLRDVARHHQVLCITHLPQIACFGDRHYRVAKSVVGERTTSQVEVLSETGRLEEIARMLGGVDVTDRTRAHAREMLARSKAVSGRP